METSTISLDESKKAIESLLEREENQFCADCDEPNPTWASITWGCFVCDNCAGAHRSLGVHNSFVKSGTVDIFTQEQIDCLSLQGNVHANGILEYHVPNDTIVPRGANDRWQRRKTYIQKKYEDLSFIRLEGVEKKNVNRESLIIFSEDDIFMPWAKNFMRIVEVKIVSLSMNKSKYSNSALYANTKIGSQHWKTEAKEFQKEIQIEENFVFSWNGEDEMLLKICDKQRKSLCKTVSEVKIQLTCLHVTVNSKIKGTFPLYTKSKKSAGSIELEISYLSLLD